jgi:hypothetical protein
VGEAARDAAALAWQSALDAVAFYVNDHCANGAHHAEIIMEMQMPVVTIGAPAGGKDSA